MGSFTVIKSELYSAWIICRTLPSSADLVGLLGWLGWTSFWLFLWMFHPLPFLEPQRPIQHETQMLAVGCSDRFQHKNLSHEFTKFTKNLMVKLEAVVSPQEAAAALPQFSEHCRVPGLCGQQRSTEVTLLCESLLMFRLSGCRLVLTQYLPSSGFTAATASCSWFRCHI